MSTTPLRVCLVALNAYPAVNPLAGGQVGGTETRAWLLARHLARCEGFDVSLVVRTTRAVVQPLVEGVRIVNLRDRLYRVRESVGGFASRAAGFPWIRVHRWSPQLLWQVPLLATARFFEARPTDPRQPMPFFQQIEADVFCCFGNQSTAATAIASAHATGRPAALFLGSDDDINPDYSAESVTRNPYGDTGATCYFSLTNADAVWTQTDEQSQMLAQRFGRESVVIPNPIDLTEWDIRSVSPLPPELTAGLERFILWIGRAEKIHKRPQVLLELAARTPEVPYLMLLNPRDPAVDAEIRRTAPSNVRIVTQVPYPLMPALFRRSIALVNTSSLEGFPNVFLQAAASRKPIVSLNVGETFLQQSGAGFFGGGDVDLASQAIVRLCESLQVAENMGEMGRQYVESQHSVEAVIPAFAAQIRRVAQTTR